MDIIVHRLELEIRGGDSIVSRLQSHAGASVASVVAEFDKVIWRGGQWQPMAPEFENVPFDLAI
jgi:hypothetical protein